MPSDVTTSGKRLTPNEARLVEALTEAAERSASLSRRELAALSGYGDSEAGRVQVSRALSRPHVRAALIESAQAILAAGAPTAAAMIRHMSAGRDSAQAHAARVDLLKMIGLGASEAPAAGNIAVQVVIPAELGASLTQARAIPSHVVVDQAVAARDHRLDEAGGGAVTPPRGARKAKAKRGGRGRKRAPGSQARAPRTISAPPEPVSGGGTDGG